ncbi:hypothetical protein BDQ12DRAFT_677051 [Crucibulum laeve]|uniref:Chromatin assembly factor 1 subunit A dimerization domain-containing protein n=1 Tax=Crucibulum laeve TaxID=68775 RepID=A0A5C3MCP7_9AGAR|nr:hypothetical protein BDQ12DRAFT_677051 [Crucibulum laeve]
MKDPLLEMSGSDVNKVNGEHQPRPGKKQEETSLIELKSGKVVCKQKCVSFEKQSETLQELVKFREMIEERIKQHLPPLDKIPDEHKPLIAKLAHESDKTLPTLSKHIRGELMPTQDEDEGDDDKVANTSAILPLNVVEGTIKTILNRNNYGLDALSGGKPPAAVCVWRWEVKEVHREWLPKNGREKAEARLAERMQAKKDLKAIFDALPQSERDAIMNPKGSNKLPVKELNKPASTDASQPVDLTSEVSQSAPKDSKTQGKKKVEEAENESATDTTPAKTARTKKQQDPEKAAKEKERLEKKVAKAEKEKKEKDAQNKSRSIMASFFAKPKVPIRAVSRETESVDAGPSKVQSDFQKSFKPFVLKKDTTLAPINWFLDPKKRGSKVQHGDVITIDIDDDEKDGEDVRMSEIQEDLNRMSVQDRLNSILRTLPSSADPSKLQHNLHTKILRMKTYHPVSVRDVINQLSEAEIAGDDAIVRSLLLQLRDRTLFPAKVFIFTGDARPGYYGTWTRNSRIIGPRSPFAKDVLVFDYSYDSGEEWEEEPAGDADDVVEDAEDEDGEEDPDSDLDSWLVDDDEEPEVSLDDAPPIDFPTQPPKRKAEDAENKLGKKRKVVVPLVPFSKGPYWEKTIGRCDYDPFKPYRIQLFNDTPFPINPFTFVSNCLEDRKEGERSAMTTAKLAPAQVTDGVFAVPPLPNRLAGSTGDPNISGTLTTFSAATGAVKKPTIAPKNPFPDTHLPFLLSKIVELKAPSIILLVEMIYQELKMHKVKKNAIEVKVREVGERCKDKKYWVVKPTVQVSDSF